MAGLLAGCATVTVRKVPAPSQYMEWTDEMQRRADEMQGIRYYMPRPFINVFESFPIRTDIYLAQGVVSPDGKYISLTSVVPEEVFSNPDAARERHAAPAGVRLPSPWDSAVAAQGRFTIPVAMVKMPPREGAAPPPGTTPGDVPRAQSAGGALGPSVAREVLLRVLQGADPPIEFKGTGLDGATLADILKNYFEQKGSAGPAPPTPLVSKLEAGKPTGIQRTQVMNDNSLYAYTPMRGNFDVVYLPDFEEQYVVNGSANLGNANVALVTGQGWSLQGLDAVADNSEINRRIFDLIDTAVQVAKTAAFKGLNFVPAAPVTQGAGGTLVLDDEAEVEWKELAGTPVTLKFVVIHYAAKGVYPVLKPRELQQRYWQTDPRFGYRYGRHFCALDLFKLFPQKTPASLVGLDFAPAPPQAPPHDAYSGGAAHGRAIGDADAPPTELSGHWLNALSGQSTIPVYPYQYISFNTFRYVAIEAIQATSTGKGPFEFPYSATGTDDVRGLARENVETLPPSARPVPGPVPPSEAEIERLLAERTYDVADGPVAYSFRVTDVKYQEGALLTARVSEISTDPQNVDEDAMKEAFNEQALGVLRAKGVDEQELEPHLDVPDAFRPTTPGPAPGP